MRRFLPLLALLTVLYIRSYSQQTPNIVYILADDLGYGDVHRFNPEGKIKTPHIDRLASQGMSFTDAHSSSAVCSPSRYSILTGRYAWRTRLSKGVLNGYDTPLIDSLRMTVADMLRNKGYTNACIGKWHLGLNWPGARDTANGKYDYTKPLTGGPLSHGFDYFYGISASLDMPPFVYIENDRTVGIPDVKKKWVREGPAEKNFDAINCVPDFTAKAVSYIRDQSQQTKPFFLYLALPSPHTPILPTNTFKGSSGVTEYGDYVAETDWAVGEVMAALEAYHLSENTLVIFTSDNGFAPYVTKEFDMEGLGHKPSYHFRGYKADIWEGGHRVPFVVRWPAKVKPNTTSGKTICLSDFMATAAAIIGTTLPDNAAEDSYNILPYLTGTTTRDIREATIHHSINGFFGIRQGNWKLELCPGSGGWAEPRDVAAAKQGLPAFQLYDMSVDFKEGNNVAAKHPDVVKRLTALLEQYARQGRSTPGAAQQAERVVDIYNKEGLKN